MQAFTDLVGTSAVPAHAFDIAELTELTPALDTAQATHDIGDRRVRLQILLSLELCCASISAAERPLRSTLRSNSHASIY